MEPLRKKMRTRAPLIPLTPKDDERGLYTWKCSPYLSAEFSRLQEEEKYIVRGVHETMPSVAYLCRRRIDLSRHRFATALAVVYKQSSTDRCLLILGSETIGDGFVMRDVLEAVPLSGQASAVVTPSITLRFHRGVENYILNGANVFVAYSMPLECDALLESEVHRTSEALLTQGEPDDKP